MFDPYIGISLNKLYGMVPIRNVLLGTSNEYSKGMFSCRKKKSIYLLSLLSAVLGSILFAQAFEIVIWSFTIQLTLSSWAQLFKTNDIVSQHIIKTIGKQCRA